MIPISFPWPGSCTHITFLKCDIQKEPSIGARPGPPGGPLLSTRQLRSPLVYLQSCNWLVLSWWSVSTLGPFSSFPHTNCPQLASQSCLLSSSSSLRGFAIIRADLAPRPPLVLRASSLTGLGRGSPKALKSVCISALYFLEKLICIMWYLIFKSGPTQSLLSKILY